MGLGHTAKVLVTGTPSIFTGGIPAARAGDERLAIMNPKLQAADTIELRADSFANGQPIPVLHSADSGSISPALHWSNGPSGTLSWALIVEDPDAPLPNPFVHWLAYNIDTSITSLPAGLSEESQLKDPPIMQGKNSSLKTGYTGCAPPKGDNPHRYFFQIFALDSRLNIKPGAGRTELLEAMEGHVLARGILVGTYQR